MTSKLYCRFPRQYSLIFLEYNRLSHFYISLHLYICKTSLLPLLITSKFPQLHLFCAMFLGLQSLAIMCITFQISPKAYNSSSRHTREWWGAFGGAPSWREARHPFLVSWSSPNSWFRTLHFLLVSGSKGSCPIYAALLTTHWSRPIIMEIIRMWFSAKCFWDLEVRQLC